MTTETDLSGNVQNTYIFFDGQRVARSDSAGAIHYYFSDHLGTHGVVENATGSACEQDVDYYPYGGEENDYCATQVAQNYKFTGKERDSESGLDNFGARYDASSLGRFMTPDWAAKPISVPYAKFGDPQTLNLYAYVENSPLNRIDADGHDSPGQMCPDCISQSQTESQVSDTNSGAAATTSAQASRANTAQDTSQQQTSQTTSNTSTSSDPIVNALEKVPGVADATPTANQPNPAATGGHRNETDTVTFKSPEEKAKFLAESGRKHTIPGDVSENGFGPGVRLPGGLHSEKGHLDAQGNLVVTSHIDRFNPNNGLAPLVGHIVWDVGVGMTFFRHSASLD